MIAPVSSKTGRAFSLVEVVIALGVATTALVTVLALLPGLLRQRADARHAMVAAGLPDALTIELRRLGGADVRSVGTAAAEFDADSSPLRLVAALDGSDLRGLADDARGKFFLIELHRFPPGSPLAFDAASTVVVLQARISWPFRPDGSAATEVPTNVRQRVSFNVALIP